MFGSRCSAIRVLSALIFFGLAFPAIAQSADQQAGQGTPPPPVFTLQTTTRVVNLEVVVKDAKGNHIKGLVPMDFQVYEQTPSRSKVKRLQTIGAFHEVSMADLARGAGPLKPPPAGIFTNAVSPQKEPVPPTVLLVDGLNTDVQNQAQVHVQMLHMLQKLPANVPVAVFLLGDRMRMLQGFTTDPKLMQAALSKASSTAGVGLAEIDPRDDSDSSGSLLAAIAGRGDPSIGVNSPPVTSTPNSNPTAGMSGFLADPGFAAMVAIAQNFDQKIFAANNDEKVYRTIVAMTSLGHNLAGYPGRKNLLWLSTTFPISLAPFGYDSPGNGGTPGADDEYGGYRNYGSQLRHLNTVLSDAKISVYPRRSDHLGVSSRSAARGYYADRNGGQREA
jgi:VWFA-related protein